MKVVTAKEMRRLEMAAAGVGLTVDRLMENAGRAAAEEARSMLAAVAGRKVLVLVGPGNNGGDGLVAARHLHDWGAEVSLCVPRPRPAGDKNFALTRERGINAIAGDSPGVLEGLLATTELVIDALFGTGKSRQIEGPYKEVLARLARARETRPALKVLAVDLPSGLDSDTGAVDPSCVAADVTVTLGLPKPGLLQFPGFSKRGKLVVADIGIPPALAADIPTELMTEEWVRSVLPARPADANKGTFGRVLVVAGSVNYIGAAYLACMGAARAGAGLVTLAVARSLQSVLAARLAEVTYLPLPEASPGVVGREAAATVAAGASGYDVLLVGCGLGRDSETVRFVEELLFDSPLAAGALVVDADALNTVAKTPQWWRRLNRDAILTPHPGEMARLLGASVEEVQLHRIETARKSAGAWGKTVVLKGAGSIVAAPDGRVSICGSANPGLASAGTGDVLAGVVAGLCAQGLGLFDAAAGGVYVHAEAGEMVRNELGDCGMLASDLLGYLPRAIRGLKAGGCNVPGH